MIVDPFQQFLRFGAVLLGNKLLQSSALSLELRRIEQCGRVSLDTAVVLLVIVYS